jgi:hypothetical protein
MHLVSHVPLLDSGRLSATREKIVSTYGVAS